MIFKKPRNIQISHSFTIRINFIKNIPISFQPLISKFTMASDLPPTHRALVLETMEDGFHVQTVPTPQPGLGNAIIRIAAGGIISYHREVYNGGRSYNFPKPIVGGVSAIGRIAALGPDSTALELGQLVFVDCMIRSRDDPDDQFLSAIHEGMTPGSRKLIRDVWRDGTWAEYAKFPLENCFALDEERLCRGLGYKIPDLLYMCHLLVAYGGFRDIRLEPGETVIVAPATGGYGGAGVMTAVAMGARVIAVGRNEKELVRLKELVQKGSPHNAGIETVRLTGDEVADASAMKAFGPVDAVLDFSPPHAAKSSHLKNAILALRRGGRASLMGWNEAVAVSAPYIISRNITMKGKLMYEREDILHFIKMLERGLFPRGKNFVDTKVFKLEDWKEALDVGADHTGIGKFVAFTP
ncbi:putative quinone oxidoreductase [Annulohypoxylon truncatum]|uniref:putative quinone oxidoreductase n=1 Tax=Annulohypoxylon truncatum TaxID=327061 RepID=UPI0020075BBC|nr:putative quinone oxidoreductase [Annulohypoxylon truncatum]KAI1207202.1 putative quinone oxidoreductase [Annulohypoxylon truncatum]